MRMGAAPVPQHVKRNTRKRRRKKSIRKGRKKRRRRRNESISLPSRMRVPTRTDNDLTRSTFSSHKSDAVAKDQRMWNRGGLGESRLESRVFGVTRVNSHLPSSKDVTPGGWVVLSQVLALDSGWFQAGELCSASSSPDAYSLWFLRAAPARVAGLGMSLWGSSRCCCSLPVPRALLSSQRLQVWLFSVVQDNKSSLLYLFKKYSLIYFWIIIYLHGPNLKGM